MISTQETFSNTNISVTGNDRISRDVQAEIQHYYSQIQAYFKAEDTIQIFGAAYDDAQWVVLEWLQAIEFLNQYDFLTDSDFGQADIAMYAHRAHIFYNIVQDKFNTTLCNGGIDWDPHLEPYKNAITNELFISSSIAMYLYFPGDNNTDPYPSPDYRAQTNKTLPALPAIAAHDPLFLDNAIKEYSWFQSHNFTNAQGLIVDGFHISPNQTTCDVRNEMVYTYNQGVLLSGLRGLWESTGSVSYLSDGYDLISVVINATGWNSASTSEAAEWAGLGRNGILEDYCDAPANCSQDDLIFKGAYFQHFQKFCEPLPTSEPLVSGVTYTASESLAESHKNQCQGYEEWVNHNAHAALSTMNGSGIMREWWGASYVRIRVPPFALLSTNTLQQVNETQSRQMDVAVSPPVGSADIRNEPWLLDTPPWKCTGQGGCKVGSLGSFAKHYIHKRQNKGPVRTVETQAQGLSVVRAAAEFATWGM